MTSSAHAGASRAGSVLRAVLLALVAFAAVAAPTAGANPADTIQSTLELDGMSIYDSALSSACGFVVVAELSGIEERKVVLGKGERVAAHETASFRGEITWYANGKSYSDKLDSRTRVEYPEGIEEIFVPAKVTVTGTNGGTFPVGFGPPGHGKFTYDAMVYATDWDTGMPYYFETSEPDWTGPGFEKATAKVCAALS
jgi:hypothetical protein